MCIIGEHHYLTLAVFLFFFPGRLARAKRIVVVANPTEHEYMEGSIPMEWDGEFGLQHPCRIL